MNTAVMRVRPSLVKQPRLRACNCCGRMALFDRGIVCELTTVLLPRLTLDGCTLAEHAYMALATTPTKLAEACVLL